MPPLIIAATLIALCGAALYIRSMFKGTTKPNRVSWLMWAIAPLIASAAALSDGITWAVLPVFMSGFVPLIVLTFSFLIPGAYWKLTKFDYLCGISSALALVLWAVTKDPNIAIIFAILSDGFAAVPTIMKSLTNPESENGIPFIIGLIGASSSFIVLNSWTFSGYAFPAYLEVVNVILIFSIYRRKLGFGRKAA